MWKKVFMILSALLALSAQTGCGPDETVYLEQAGEEFPVEDTETSAAFTQAGEADKERDIKEEPETLAGEEPGTGMAGEETKAGVLGDEMCCVYVCGAVKAPGVYMLHGGGRVYEAVAYAGGLTDDACAQAVNQAETVTDGQMVFIPTEEEAEAYGTGAVPGIGTGKAAGTGEKGPSAETAGRVEDGRLDLNEASAEELMTLPGIGRSKADSIIAYRTAQGGFQRPEDIMNVEGIKEGVYNRIKDSIKVK